MRFLHAVNAVAWGMNAVLWFLYAHSAFMGFTSLVAMGAAIYLARQSPDYIYRR
jgi:hypothetical protein